MVGNQATGTPHIASEIAAPLVSRTPMGTVATATNECGWKRGDTTGGKDNRAESSSGETRIRKESRTRWGGTSALKARMRRCLILRQGASPLRSPAPFPSDVIIGKGGSLSRVRYAGQKRAALDRLPPFRTNPSHYEGKGALGGAGFRVPPVGRLPTDANFEALNQGEIISLTQTGLLMEAARVSEPRCPYGVGSLRDIGGRESPRYSPEFSMERKGLPKNG